MGILKKLIGLFLIVVMLLLLVNLPSVVSSVGNIAIGPVKTPIQVGSTYLTPGNPVFGTFVIRNPQGVNKTFGKVGITQIDSVLSLTTENMVVPQGNWSLWLADTPNVSNQTNYVDFGYITPSYTYKGYSVVVPENFNLGSYRYLMIVNSQDYNVFAIAQLKK